MKLVENRSRSSLLPLESHSCVRKLQYGNQEFTFLPHQQVVDPLSQLGLDLALCILRKWVTSQREWRTAKLTSKSWLPHVLCDEVLENITLRGVLYDSPRQLSMNFEYLHSMVSTLRHGNFRSLQTLTLKNMALPKPILEPGLMQWETASQLDIGFQSLQDLTLTYSWPFSYPVPNKSSCADAPRLIALELGMFRYKFPFPVAMGQLQHLQTLRLHFVFSIPDVYRSFLHLLQQSDSFPSLKHLYMPKDAGSIPFPVGLVQRTRLETLHIHCNLPLPQSLTEMVHLRDFAINGSFHKGPIQDIPVWRMRGLQRLSLLLREDAILPEVSSVPLSNLKYLKLRSAPSSIPKIVSYFPALESLDLGEVCEWSVPASLSQLSHLTSVKVNSTALKTLPAEFGKLAQLVDFEVQGNKSGEAPRCIFKLTNLTRLAIGCVFQIPEEIRKLTRLMSLTVGSFSLHLTSLAQLSSLEILNQDPIEFSNTFESLKMLEELRFSCSHESSLPMSLTQLRRLRVLNLQGSQALKSLPDWIGQLSMLEQLIIWPSVVEILPQTFFQLPCLTSLHCSDALERKYRDEFCAMPSLVEVKRR